MTVRFLLALLLIGPVSTAQTQLKFSELLTYAYTRDGKPAETSVYLDRKTSTWLFTNDDTFGGRAESLAFVVAYANGTYLLCGTDDTGTNSCQRHRLSAAAAMPARKGKTPTISGKPTGKHRVFGKNNYGWPTLTGIEYVLDAGRMQQTAYLAKVPFSPYPLYAYNTLIRLEFPLPIFQQLNYATGIPRNQLVVGEGVPGSTTLTSLSPTEYFLDLRPYRITDAKP